MVKYAFFTMAGLAVALPLNINLGAYSPALVVGDGEISFGGNQDVSSLINALEGAAVNAAAGARAEGNVVAPVQVAPVQIAPAGGVAPVTVASADPNLQEQATQFSAVQGMGKEIAPREETKTVAKRDLAGFDRALRFAEVGLTQGPKIQLGTGAEGSGVGIIVDNRAGVVGAERPGGGAAAEKRDVEAPAQPVRARVTTMYIRNGLPEALQPANSVARDVSAAAALPAAAVPASRRDAIDAINLNVDGNQGVTMTFIETVGDDED